MAYTGTRHSVDCRAADRPCRNRAFASLARARALRHSPVGKGCASRESRPRKREAPERTKRPEWTGTQPDPTWSCQVVSCEEAFACRFGIRLIVSTSPPTSRRRAARLGPQKMQWAGRGGLHLHSIDCGRMGGNVRGGEACGGALTGSESGERDEPTDGQTTDRS